MPWLSLMGRQLSCTSVASSQLASSWGLPMVAERPMSWGLMSILSRVRMISKVGPLLGSLRRWISSMTTVLISLSQETRCRRRESSFSVVRIKRW